MSAQCEEIKVRKSPKSQSGINNPDIGNIEDKSQNGKITVLRYLQH